jgi:branched-chain amino acid transport system substrate-binding protein
MGAVVVLSLVLMGCGSKPVVGVLLPTTGTAGGYGESIESGIRLAVTDAMNRGQLPQGFEVVWADSESDGDRAVEELRRLTGEHGANLVIGGATSGEARSLLPFLEDLQVVVLSPSASAPDLTKNSKFFFRIYPSDELEGNAAGKFLFDRMNRETLLLFIGENEYTRGIEPEFVNQYENNLGGTIVERVELASPDWEQVSAAAIRSHQPSAVYIIAYAEQTLQVLAHLRERAYAGTVMTTSAFDSTRIILEAGELAEDVIFPLPPFDRTSDQEPIMGFVERYLDTYQRAPDILAAHGYDAMRLAIEVVRLAQPLEVSEIKKALHFGVSEFVGVTGPILFDDYGDVKHYPKMYIIKQGQVLSYQRYMEAERKRILREVQSLLVSGK